ncbi:MAG: N-acetylmuramoyl-L-alanine amidase [Ktedonobacteraceae bacterium]|nr:N-acetylmuramoyl-L-alanine amidase [Ktedonobacteraceae bacterium]
MRPRKSFIFPSILVIALLIVGAIGDAAVARAQTQSISAVFDQAASASGVPASLLKALCYMEGRLSNHGGSPSVDGGYGCMHLVTNDPNASALKGGKDGGIGTNMTQSGRADTLDSAAKDLGVTTDQLKTDLATNIRGGAAVLRDSALQLSPNHTLPTALADWYGAVAAYSNATTQSTARLYADSVYSLLNKGFSAPAENGEVITLAPQAVKPNVTLANAVKATTTLPSGCVDDGKTDYPGAINCILDPASYDCLRSPDEIPCNYETSDRPNVLPLNYVVIHDIEGTAQDAINVFQNVNNGVSIHYIVDSDGTVYQIVHEKDIAYQAGNFWYNQRSIGIEHAGFDATGFLWYNATEYLASAKLTAYLLKKYNIPLDHDHIVSHGIIPSPTLATSPNHVDPGPYWLWDYYFAQIHKQGVAYPQQQGDNSHIITLRPSTDQKPFGKGGTETAANFNFFYLYNGPGTRTGLIPGNGMDITIEDNNVEPTLSYYYLAKVKDPDGSGKMLYQIWYGESDHLSDSPSSFFANGKLAWLAVPPGAVVEGTGTPVKINLSTAKIYGRPVSSDSFVIGDAPSGAIFVSPLTVVESGTNTTWYSINYNHRQAWVQAGEVTTA